jgi:hypothetical protein
VLTDRTKLADQLIQPLFNEHAIALTVDVSPPAAPGTSPSREPGLVRRLLRLPGLSFLTLS